MSTADQPTIYDELLDLFTGTANVERLGDFRLSSDKRSRIDVLLQRNRDSQLSPSDRAELDEFERLEHLGRMLKARLLRNRDE